MAEMTIYSFDAIKTNDNRVDGTLPPQVEAKNKTDEVTYTCSDRVMLPILPLDINATWEMDIYARFMRHLRCVPNSRMEIKILHAIKYVADMMDVGEDHVAKILVDLGLRAPRLAFPASFLDFADGALIRSVFECGGIANVSLNELRHHWDALGEDKFAAMKRPAVLRDPPMYVRVMLDDPVR
jgi:hypothetical protein